MKEPLLATRQLGLGASGCGCDDGPAQAGGRLLVPLYRIIEKKIRLIDLEWIDRYHKRANQKALSFYINDISKPYKEKFVKPEFIDFYIYQSVLNNALITFAKSSFEKYLGQFKKSNRYILINNEKNENLLLKLENRYCKSYQKKVKKRMNWLCYIYGNSKAVLLTLTIDPKKYNNEKLKMWFDIKKQYHRFITGLKYYFKKQNREFPPYVCCIEAQRNGNPHLHIVFLGATRLIDWRKIRNLWHQGFIYINRTYDGQKIRYPINYITKYLTKTYSTTDDSNLLTQSLSWLFNIRSYNCSQDLLYPLKSKFSGEWKANYLCIIDKDIDKISFSKKIDIIFNMLNSINHNFKTYIIFKSDEFYYKTLKYVLNDLNNIKGRIIS